MKELEELEFEKILWAIFIVVSALNIYGDNIQELFLQENQPEYEKESKTIFTFTITISLLIYLYFMYRNYKKVEETKQQNENTLLPSIRLFGSILIVVGVIMVLYYQINEKTPLGTPTA